MSDGYWRYAGAVDPRLPQPSAPPSAPLKRPRSDFQDVSGGPEMVGYYPRGEERTTHYALRDTESINASYDRYLRNGIYSFGSADAIRPVSGEMTVHPVDDPRLISGGIMDGSGGIMDGRSAGFGSGRPEAPLPPDASNTLFVEGLPANVTRREVSHIFRPFVGFREVRLVNKDSRHPGGDPLVLCFCDFATAKQAAVALVVLQGYKFDEHDRQSASLRLQFARFAGPRSAGGPRGRR